ncbi:hypothetical protein OAD49_00495 [Flavobacteriaceae bacterium]|nr:hypothetical protein [Flavobacteriaceae bacterium]
MIKIKARVYFYKHHGRETPIDSGYRPAFCFEQKKDFFFTGHIELVEKKLFEVGMQDEVYITFINADLLKGQIKEGKTFSINEPPIEVGEGEILEIIT